MSLVGNTVRGRGIDELLGEARSRIDRVDAERARREQREGEAVLVDIRPAAQRAEFGEIPGALVVERNVLEWRFDPRSDARLPVADYDLRVIVVCQEGYTSSLAAAALLDLGIERATDLAGGYAAWRIAGLPTQSGPTPQVVPPALAAHPEPSARSAPPQPVHSTRVGVR